MYQILKEVTAAAAIVFNKVAKQQKQTLQNKAE
jgi:hypothetical protein